MPTADLIFTNANVITVDPRQPRTEFVAVKHEKILFAGSKGQVNDFTGPNTTIIDCGGKTVVPGFNDAHCHIFSYVRKITAIDLSPPKIKSISDIKTAVKEKAEQTPAGKWITGTDYNEFYLAEKRHPTRWDLDEVSPNHPVILSHRSLHGCVLNSLGLELAGIKLDTPEFPGTMIGRDPDRGGEPNGFLAEMLGYIREHIIPPITEDELKSAIQQANAEYLSTGLTSLQDATFVNDIKRWHHYQQFQNEGLLTCRVYMMSGVETVQEFQTDGMHFGDGNEYLRLGAVKIVPALIADRLHPSQDELNAFVLRLHKQGFQLAIHGIQIPVIDAIVSSYEYLQRISPDFSNRRHRIEHCSECPPDLMERIAKLQPVIVTHPSFTYYSGDRYLATVEKNVTPWLYRLGTMVNRELTVAGASDSPIVPNNPLMGIYGAVTRRTTSGSILNQNESLTAAEVLKFYTLNAAYASHEETIKGSITPGKLADLVLLTADPTKGEVERIPEIKVEMTVVGGKVVWES